MSNLKLGDREFVIDPNIGHCIQLQAAGIDLLGFEGDSQLEKLIAHPVHFMTVLETLIADQAADDDRFRMPALAAFMKGGTWPASRIAVLEAFGNFFRENDYRALAAGLDRMTEAAAAVTNQVSESLESGELKKRIDAVVAETVAELTATD